MLGVTGGEGWEPLCRFLGQPVPDAPFPRVNTAGERRRQGSRLGRLSGRVRRALGL